LIPFIVTIPVDERDTKLTKKLETEWPGILKRLITGCLDWQKQGLTPPEAVTTATEDYLEAEDALGQWIVECCDTKPQYLWGSSASLFASWRQWAEVAGEFVSSQKRFCQSLEARGYEPQRQPGTGARGFSAIAAVRSASTEKGW
jgi:putative DNA primase/helicase